MTPIMGGGTRIQGDEYRWGAQIQAPFVPGWYWLRGVDTLGDWGHPTMIPNLDTWRRCFEGRFEVAGPIPWPAEAEPMELPSHHQFKGALI